MIEEILNKEEVAASQALLALGFDDATGALKNLKLLSAGPLKANIETILRRAIKSPSPGAALNNLELIARELPEGHLSGLATPEIERLITIAGSSHFLSNILARSPESFEWIFLKAGLDESKELEAFRSELREAVSDVKDNEGMARALRLFKQKEFLRIGARDLLGLSPMEEVTRELADIASASLDAAYGYSLNELEKIYGEPMCTEEDGTVKTADFVVMGLGKLGGRELNFSSDIDIIYLYSSDKGETNGVEGRPDSIISLHAFFVKLSMMINRLIGSVTGDGIVFRVDLDLRPEGRSGDMANSLRSAEIYYESWGQSWERSAMIKARPVAGSLRLGEEFLYMIRPFVWRRYLDFTAIEEIKSMKEKIDLSLLRRNPDTIDVKLGAGGIREIEFFCQALELIHAGKDAGIREGNTLKALEKLLSKGFIKEKEYGLLRDGYVFLRNLEHRIQIVEGRQSQAIPAEPGELERLARMMGFTDTGERKAGDFFWEEYKRKTSSVHEVYRSLFYRPDEAGVPEEVLVLFSPDIQREEALKRLFELGFKDAGGAYKNLNLLRSGPPFVRLSARARVLLEKLAPVLLARAFCSADPDRTLSSLEGFISAVGARTAFYSLLSENPKVIDELVGLFGASVFLSRALIEHPESLDLLLSKELSVPYKTKRLLLDEVSLELDKTGDYEERLDLLRRWKNQEVLRVGINDVLGALNPRLISVQLTSLAEACLEASLRIAYAELKRIYGEPEGACFSIIGLGKLGGKEMNYGSDLDIVFVYSDPGEGKTPGPRAIASHEFFVKIAQRVISILSLRTKDGFVFNVDTRLRPSGSSGPLVVSKESIINYHRARTQVWERQAMIRARAVAGDMKMGEAVVNGLREILYSKPLTIDDINEMLRIRKRMEVEIAKEDSTRYNIKTGKGGLVDIEFLVQASELKYGEKKACLRTPYTLKALKRLSKEGAIKGDEYQFLKEAYAFFRLLEQRLRIVHDRPEGYLCRGSEEIAVLAKRFGYSGADAGEELILKYRGYADRVREFYLKTLESLAR